MIGRLRARPAAGVRRLGDELIDVEGDTMSKRIGIGSVLAVAALLLATNVAAQQEPPRPYVYGIYFECDVARQALADEIFELAYLPAFEAAVADGTITSFGWLAHHTGGKWRRVLYHSAPDMGSLLAALEKVNGAIDEKYPELGRAFSEVCGTHEDYIWQAVAGSRGGDVAQPRGEVGFSVYMQCDMAGEARADELFTKVFAPIFDRQVAAGKLASWGWMEHVVGGKWRRIETMTANDEATLIAARTAIIDEIMGPHAEAGREFDSICGSHQDYIWTIQHEKP
jgi:hypothetical protein